MTLPHQRSPPDERFGGTDVGGKGVYGGVRDGGVGRREVGRQTL